MNLVVLSILLAATTCVLVLAEDSCICKIETNHTNMRYCGFELRDPNCYPQAEYKCKDGENNKALLLGFCPGPCHINDGSALCQAYTTFQTGSFKNVQLCSIAYI
jgi:hypothetical protein